MFAHVNSRWYYMCHFTAGECRFLTKLTLLGRLCYHRYFDTTRKCLLLFNVVFFFREEVLSIISMLSVDTVFISNRSKVRLSLYSNNYYNFLLYFHYQLLFGCGLLTKYGEFFDECSTVRVSWWCCRSKSARTLTGSFYTRKVTT